MSWRQDLPALREIEFGGWPRQTALADYARATEEVLELVERATRNASVYQVGGVNTPGISDLDFIVVLNDPAPQADLDQWGAAASAFSPQAQYIVDNKPLIVNPQLWNVLPLLHNLADFRHLAGPVLPPPVVAGPGAALSHLFDEIERRLFVSQKLERYLLKRSVHVRTAIKKISKIRIQADMLAEFGVQKAAWTEFNDAVSNLRRDWFTLDRAAQTDALYPLIATHGEIDAQIILEMSKLLVQAGMQFPESMQPDRSVVGAFDFGKLFAKDYQPEFRLDCMHKSYLVRGELTSVLPATFMLPVLIYASRSPALKSVFQNRLTAFGEVPDVSRWDLEAGLGDRVRILDQYLNFIHERGYSWGLFFRMWNFPRLGPEDCRRFWQAAQRPIEQGADILPFLLRKQLGATHPHLARFVGRKTTKAYVRLRVARERIAPLRRLRRRVITSLRKALSAPPGAASSQP